MSTSDQSHLSIAALQPLLALCLPLAKPFLAQFAEEILAQRQANEAKLGDRLGYTEPETASLIGVAQHVLRDARRRGEISARLVGKKFIYERSEILRFLRDRD